MTSREPAERVARNESIFRELNDHLDAITHGSPTDERDFVCECADMSCAELVSVALGDYESVRSDPQRFIVSPDPAHVDAAFEQVTDQRDNYWIVEKVGIAGAVAEDLDSRN